MRPIKELLQIVLDDIKKPKSYYGGICVIPMWKYLTKIIIKDELSELESYLENNLPEKKYSSIFGTKNAYCWPYGETEPRIKWLEEQINKL